MSNNIVQLTDYNDNNIYPIAGAAAQGSITKTMLDEGVFVGAELSDPGNIAYVGTADIQDDAVTTAKIADLNVTEGKLASNSVTTSKIADGSVTSDKIDWTTYDWTGAGGAVSLHAFGKIVIVTLRVAGFSTDPTIGASDSSPLQITTLPIAPIETIVGPTNCMTAANVNVPDIFFEVSTSGILRLRNYSNTAKTIHRVSANFSFMAAQ